jgi:hypothetical protein
MRFSRLCKMSLLTILISLVGCSQSTPSADKDRPVMSISRAEYSEKLQGFWLGQNIANWTGLITEMDKVGTPETMPFYTDDDWGKPDLKAMWGEYVPHASHIKFYFQEQGQPWGSDDDTDIEYIYSFLHDQHRVSKLSAEQIRNGWLKHIYSETDAPLFQKFPDSQPQKENFLWVSNERARILMEQGMSPPETSDPANNSNSLMIDAQLTTELFGLLAPARADIAVDIALLPIRTTATLDAQWISQFYVAMHALASRVDSSISLKRQTQWLAEQAKGQLPTDSSAAKIYEFVKNQYLNNPDKDDWESTRDAVYQRYQLSAMDGYTYHQPFDAGINFAASLVSLFYGEGDIKRTVQIGALAGWDSDNPTATWGGLLGFMLGKQGVETAFNQTNLSNTYSIHRTRRNFPDQSPNQLGEDTFANMAARDLRTIDRVVVELMQGTVNTETNRWIIPL